jgi:Trk-type K+ transport system membrane component
MIAASAVGNVGLSHEPLSVRGVALTTLVLAMLIGRAGPLMVLWWAAGTCEGADVGV